METTYQDEQIMDYINNLNQAREKNTHESAPSSTTYTKEED